MTIDSPLPPASYKAAVRDKLENFRNFWDERFSGHFIGPVFCITHHSYWEWNRRTTGEMNNAIGFLKKTETGCRVHYIHTTGILTPFHLVVYFLLFMVISILYWRNDAVNAETAVTASGVVSVICLVMFSLISAISNALTENGIRGGDTLHALMEDPTFGQGE